MDFETAARNQDFSPDFWEGFRAGVAAMKARQGGTAAKMALKVVFQEPGLVNELKYKGISLDKKTTREISKIMEYDIGNPSQKSTKQGFILCAALRAAGFKRCKVSRGGKSLWSWVYKPEIVDNIVSDPALSSQ